MERSIQPTLFPISADAEPEVHPLGPTDSLLEELDPIQIQYHHDVDIFALIAQVESAYGSACPTLASFNTWISRCKDWADRQSSEELLSRYTAYCRVQVIHNLCSGWECPPRWRHNLQRYLEKKSDGFLQRASRAGTAKTLEMALLETRVKRKYQTIPAKYAYAFT